MNSYEHVQYKNVFVDDKNEKTLLFFYTEVRIQKTKTNE